MRFTARQRIERFNAAHKATQDLRKVLRKAIKKWKKANKGPVGRKISAKFNKFIKFII